MLFLLLVLQASNSSILLCESPFNPGLGMDFSRWVLVLLSFLLLLTTFASAYYYPSLAQQFLAPQNAARARVGVPPLVWDNQLAGFAQSWANRQRIFGACLLRHSGGPFGENIFWGSGRNWVPSDAINSWMNEQQWYDYNRNSCHYYNACGHYTQVVSRFSQRVGCARVVCTDGDVFMTCNYYPPGNNGQRPY